MDLSKYIFKTKSIVTKPSTVHLIELEDTEWLNDYKVYNAGLSQISIETKTRGFATRMLYIKNSDPAYEHEVILLIMGKK